MEDPLKEINEKVDNLNNVLEYKLKNYLPKKTVAAEVYKRLHLQRGILVGTMGAIILAACTSGWFAVGFAGISSSLLAWLLYKNVIEMKYLATEYNLDIKKFKVENE